MSEETPPDRPTSPASPPHEGEAAPDIVAQAPEAAPTAKKRRRRYIAQAINVIGAVGAIAGLVAALLAFPCRPRGPGPPPPPPPNGCAELLAASGGPPVEAAISICEVIPDPPGPDPDNEKITLCNAGGEPAEIGSWRLRDNHGEYVLPDGAAIPPGGRFEILGTVFNPDRLPRGIFLNNQHDCVLLFDAGGTLIAHRVWPE